MSVLLISVQPNLDIIGLKGLHHLLLANGHQSTLLYLPRFDIASSQAKAHLNAFVENRAPKLIGISLMAIDYRRAVAVTEHLKRGFPNIPVVWGGLHPTTAPEMCLDHADYVCIGEGEKALLDMACAAEQAQSFADICNLAYRHRGVLRQNALHPLIQDLDTLPIVEQIPSDSFAQLKTKVEPVDTRLLRKCKRWSGGVYKLLASRGCPYACSYCANNFFRSLYANWRVRRRSVSHIMEELEHAVRNGPPLEYVDFSDDCFLASDVEYLREFCQQYKARIGKPFIVKGTPRYLTREKMDLLVDAGLAWANLGLQSGSERVCFEVYHRTIPPQEVLEASRLIHEYPVAAYYDIILDNPFETTEDLLHTAEILMEMPKPYYPLIFSLVFYYGTELYARMMRECPQWKDICLEKNYEIRENRTINTLVEVAGFMHRPIMRRLIAKFRKEPDAASTRFALMLSKLYVHLILGPAAYLRLIKRAQKGSLWRTFRVLPVYFDHGLVYYLNNFAWFRKRSGVHRG